MSHLALKTSNTVQFRNLYNVSNWESPQKQGYDEIIITYSSFENMYHFMINAAINALVLHIHTYYSVLKWENSAITTFLKIFLHSSPQTFCQHLPIQGI